MSPRPHLFELLTRLMHQRQRNQVMFRGSSEAISLNAGLRSNARTDRTDEPVDCPRTPVQQQHLPVFAGTGAVATRD
jgi:hypothetical protein